MTLFGKTIITIIVLGIIGISGYMYATRPIALPSDSGNMQATSTDSVDATNTATGSNSTIFPTASVASYRIAAGTKAEFNIDEVLRGEPFTVVGTTADVSGSVQADLVKPEDSVIGTFKINARTFKTDSPNRDTAIARFILKSEDASNEFITFEVKEISGVQSDAGEKVLAGETVSFKIKGDLTITGITKSTTFNAKFALVQTGADAGKIKGIAEAKIKRSDFKLVIPNIPFVANVPDEFLIKIDAVLVR
jgi:polyisoprenoid-binding protein YceI